MCRIPFHSVFYEGIIPTAVYSVVNDNKEYCGEIHVAFTFTPEVNSYSYIHLTI